VSSAFRSDQGANSGFVLVAVLWILAALATLASIYSTYAVNTADASHVADDRVQAEASVRAGIEMAALQQLAAPKPLRPSHGGFNLRVGRTQVVVKFSSEASRVDLNAAPADLLAGLASAVGGDPVHAAFFADRVIGWRTKTQPNVLSKEAKLYADQGVPYPPRQAPFDNALELSLLPGIPKATVERILPFVTVFSGRAQIDVATADPALLSALPGITPQILGAVLKERGANRVDGQALLGLLGPAKDHATVDRSDAIRAAVEVRFDNSRRVQAEVVFRLREEGEEPYDVLYWRDDFDGPTEMG